MYLNYKLLFEHGLNPIDYHILQAAKQNAIEDMEFFLASIIQDDEKTKMMLDKSYLKLIKGKSTDSELKKLRIDKKGINLLEDLSVPEVTVGDVQLFDYLAEMYLRGGEERKIGSKNKVKLYIAILRNHLGLSLHQMYWFLNYYIEKEEFTFVLEYLFFNPNKQRYSKFQNSLSDARVVQFWEENQKEILNIFKIKNL